MKIMLTFFILTVLCSYALSTETEILSNNQISALTLKWNVKDSILPNGKKLHSANGKFYLHMSESDCRLHLKNSEEKTLWTTPTTKTRNCMAILRGSSNFEVVSGNIIVWSTRTSAKESGKGPYRMYINKSGNLIVKNNVNNCIWALYGCPVTKTLQAFKAATPQKKWAIARTLFKIQARRTGGLPIRQLPVAKTAKKIPNQTPKILKRQTPPAPLPSIIIPKGRYTYLKNLFIEEGEDALSQLKKSLKGKVSRRQVRKLEKLVAKDVQWPNLKKMAKRNIKKQAKREIQRLKKLDRQAAARKPKPIKTRKQLTRRISNMFWMRRVKTLVARRAKPKQIKNVLRKMGNVRGKPSFWRRLGRALRRGARRVKRGVTRAARSTGRGVTRAARTVSRGVTRGARSVSRGVTRASRSVGRGVTRAARTVGRGVTRAARAVGRGVKTEARRVNNIFRRIVRLVAFRSVTKSQRKRVQLTSRSRRLVTKKRLELYRKNVLTWHWRTTFTGYWQRVCRRWWWWRSCWNVYRRNYYSYRHYYYTPQWNYRWVEKTVLE